MAVLTVHRSRDWTVSSSGSDPREIASRLERIDVGYAHLSVDPSLDERTPKDEVMSRLSARLDPFRASRGFSSMEVEVVRPDTPDLAELAASWRTEHTHNEAEARFFVTGMGSYALHAGAQIWSLLVFAGDWVEIPAGMAHWFEVGTHPSFTAVRLFSDPEGSVPHPTGSDIAGRAPR